MMSCEQYKTTTRTGELKNDSGHVYATGELIYKRSNKMDMYDYYQKWENTYTEYYDNGTIKSIYTSQHKAATYGRQCRELISHYTSFYPNGVKKYELKEICDCSKSISLHYNEQGKLIEKRVIKTTTKEIKKPKN